MKKIINFITSGFKSLGYDYYTIIYWHNGEPEKGYVIIHKYKFFWIEGYKRVGVCTSKEELDSKMEIIKKIFG